MRILRRVRDYLSYIPGLAMLALGCIVWTLIAHLLGILPATRKPHIGQRLATVGLRLYLFWLWLVGAARFDIAALDALRDEPAMLLAPNHPGMLDAFMITSRLPRLVSVAKASLLENFWLGASARRAGYIRNDWFVGTTALSVEALQRGEHVLIFPEGTRTERFPVNAMRGAAPAIAHRANVPVQILIIESNTPFLCKGWSWFCSPAMPMRFSIRLGPRIEPPHDGRTLPGELEAHFTRELAAQVDAPVYRFLRGET